jgi:broad specificity phosphatase PhoE
MGRRHYQPTHHQLLASKTIIIGLMLFSTHQLPKIVSSFTILNRTAQHGASSSRVVVPARTMTNSHVSSSSSSRRHSHSHSAAGSAGELQTNAAIQDVDTKRTNTKTTNTNKTKRIVLIRHGTTFMNEKLATPGTEWGDAGFMDDWSFRDTLLSPKGMRQCQDQLAKNIQLQQLIHHNDIDLFAISPLTRTLQTFHHGVYVPHYIDNKDKDNNKDNDNTSNSSSRPRPMLPRVVAVAEAAERVYLASDIGSSVETLSIQFPYVDFESELPRMMTKNVNVNVNPQQSKCDDNDPTSGDDEEHAWWWTPQRHGMEDHNIDEWRPTASTYIHAGEPDDHFEHRMALLYQWLAHRSESTICLVAHWGVIQHLTGGHSFDNCQVRTFDFDELPVPVPPKCK